MLRIVFVKKCTPFRSILQLACVAVVPAEVWIICHTAIPGSSGISQVKLYQQLQQPKAVLLCLVFL